MSAWLALISSAIAVSSSGVRRRNGGEWEPAIALYDAERASRAALGDVRYEAYALRAIGICRAELGDDESAIETLTALPGIGRWSAEIYLMFCLGRPDVWPVGDLGIVLGLQSLFGLPARPKPAEAIVLGERWLIVDEAYLRVLTPAQNGQAAHIDLKHISASATTAYIPRACDQSSCCGHPESTTGCARNS